MTGAAEEALPEAIDAAMHALFALPEDDQRAAFERLLLAHPRHAALLQTRWCSVLDEDGASLRGVERYRIEGRIGAGGMGEVLRARDLLLDRPVAIKVVRGGAAAWQRFHNEARITAQLDHPGVVPVHDLGTDAAGRSWFVMRLVEGHSADAVLASAREGSRQRARALEVVLKVCDTVAFAHARGVVHRDLKPANVMVGAFGEVYVMDWGLAKASGTGAVAGTDAGTASPGLTLAGSVLGTPSYMPPERAGTAIEPADPRADVYATGAMLYQVLTGSAPYAEHGDGSAILAALRNGPPPPVERCQRDAPAALVAICNKAMARELPQRYVAMGELAADLRAFLDARVVKAYRTGPIVELLLWVRRNRALARALFATAAVVLVALAVVLVAWRDSEQSRHRFRRLASVVQLEEATRQAATLYPPWPELVPALRRWQAGFEVPLQRERELLATELQRLAARALPPAKDDAGPRFHDVDDGILHASLGRHAAELEAFFAPGGLAARVRERLAWAEGIAADSIDRHAERWHAARAIAAADPRLYGLDLQPQVGLVPLGPDPVTGLLEFADLRSGPPPRRDATGSLEYADDSGIVFVLLPGGSCSIGAQAEVPEATNYWPGAKADEAPVERVQLQPFLLGKHEVTQAQWQRLSGYNPSLAIGRGSARHPVGYVSWLEAERVLRENGMVLPTEAQWEYGCRAGSTHAWATGDDVASLLGHANVADESARGQFGPGFRYEATLRDGWVTDAPVGTFTANALGLHDLHGNHDEWCLDVYRAPRCLHVPGTAGVREGAEVHRVYRGGSYAQPADNFARCAYRGKAPADTARHDLGLRAARQLR
jgi:formylglycine-generating enzyme required for sulfatase activity